MVGVTGKQRRNEEYTERTDSRIEDERSKDVRGGEGGGRSEVQMNQVEQTELVVQMEQMKKIEEEESSRLRIDMRRR